MTVKLLPATLGNRESSTGVYEENNKGLSKFQDYLLFIRGHRITKVMDFVPATTVPEERICARFRTTNPKCLADYQWAVKGRDSSIKLDDKVIPTVNLETTIRYLDNAKWVPPVFNTEVTRGEYSVFRKLLPKISDARVLNYLDLLYKAHPSESHFVRPERVLSLHISSEDLSDLSKVRVEARIYRKEMPENLIRFIEDTVKDMAVRYNLRELEMLSRKGFKVYDRKEQ